MATVFLVLVVVLVVAALVFGVVSLLAGDDPGLSTAEPDGRARPLPNTRSLTESDLKEVRFDVGLRGYRMTQVDRVLRRTAYDLGYKDEMIAVLEAEVIALRDGRMEDAELLRKARESAANPASGSGAGTTTEHGDQATGAVEPPTWAPTGHFAKAAEPTDSAGGAGPDAGERADAREPGDAGTRADAGERAAPDGDPAERSARA